MSELTLESFERLLNKQLANLPTKKDLEGGIGELGEMIEFLTKQAAHKDDLRGLASTEQMDKKFAEQAVSLTFIESNISTLRKDLQYLATRTKEDDGAFVKDILKLKNRMNQFEKQLKKLKVARV